MADWLGASLITSRQSPGRGGSGWGSRPNVFLGSSASRKANTRFEIVKSQEHKNSFNLPNFGGLSLSASSQPQKTWKQRQKCQVWGGIGRGGGGEECFQKEGVKLGSQAGKERTSGNMSASWSRPGPSAPGQGPCTMKDQLWPQGSGSDRPACQMQRPVPSSTHLRLRAGHSTSLSLTGPIWKMGTVTVLMFPGGHEDRMRTQRAQISTVPSAH